MVSSKKAIHRHYTVIGNSNQRERRIERGRKREFSIFRTVVFTLLEIFKLPRPIYSVDVENFWCHCKTLFFSSFFCFSSPIDWGSIHIHHFVQSPKPNLSSEFVVRWRPFEVHFITIPSTYAFVSDEISIDCENALKFIAGRGVHRRPQRLLFDSTYEASIKAYGTSKVCFVF